MNKNIIIYDGIWCCEYVQKNRNYLFLFGDNDAQFGKGGQAIIRNEKNVIGIPTKKFPSYAKSSFYNDLEIESNKLKISNAVEKIEQEFAKNIYTSLIIPINGYGTGRANLNVTAPKTFAFLKKSVCDLVDEIQINSSGNIKWE